MVHLKKKDAIDKSSKYHLWDLDAPEGKPHNLPVSEDRMMTVKLLEETFEPSDYIDWDTTGKWIYPRDWGDKS